MEILFVILLALTSPFSSNPEHQFDSGNYFETERFKGPQENNFVGTLYICAHLADTEKYVDDFQELIEQFANISGITPADSEALYRDAQRWWDLRPKNANYKVFWNDMCKEPTENMRNYFKSQSQHP
ncbi:hypothetical protein J6I90_00970 [Pseudidiomarina sp. 1APP75-32.1]|uniref:Uncharacterized protein n=1 Tax=Pseudidiomarina terrestris TaxID=2820060 RepID=A0AAW7QUP6_9GAMM|nr:MULTISPECIES: hypothetical protein [unclassified Pseudidiomarina]MDN7123449.1 hypothetical protein [Pseudidiomarina sp. 1APP75-32.1]MDN7128826.1 hypothetical protein [Pseudidiomarina sp. 1APR75-15]